MNIAILFILGIANFALNKAVQECDNDMVQAIFAEGGFFSPRIALTVEFVVLLVAMLLVDHGHIGWGWAYVIYTIINGFTAWSILTGRI